MQVFGLPRHVTRGAALKRWRRARDNGLSAADAAAAVGVSRATLYRWRKLHDQGRLAPRSRRPRRSRWGAMASAFRRRRPLRPISAASKAPPRECPEIIGFPPVVLADTYIYAITIQPGVTIHEL